MECVPQWIIINYCLLVANEVENECEVAIHQMWIDLTKHYDVAPWNHMFQQQTIKPQRDNKLLNRKHVCVGFLL